MSKMSSALILDRQIRIPPYHASLSAPRSIEVASTTSFLQIRSDDLFAMTRT